MKEGIAGIALGRKDLLRIDPRQLHVRPDWNCRDVNFDPADAEDLALAQSIATVGVKQPLTVVWDDGKTWLTDGHRRLAAALYAMDNLGAEIKSVPVQTEDRYASEADRVLSQIVRNNGKALSPIESSRVYKRLIDLGWTEKQIADSIGRSLQWVKNLLELNAAPVEVTTLVRSGKVSATFAMDTLRKAGGNGAKAAVTLTKAIDKAATAGKAKATPKHVEKAPAPAPAPAAERKTYEELAQELDEAFRQYGNRIIRHVQSGVEYRIIGVQHREFDMTINLEYTPIGDFYNRVKFGRTLAELAFGTRFVFADTETPDLELDI